MRSLANETLSLPAEVELEALSPLVIAANKLVGLAWRVMRRGSGDAKEEDRNLVRHLHDLAALEEIIHESRERFSALVAQVIQSDRPRYAELNVAPEDLLLKAKQLVTEDARYEQEYNRFVTRMSFATNLPASRRFWRKPRNAHPLIQ